MSPAKSAGVERIAGRRRVMALLAGVLALVLAAIAWQRSGWRGPFEAQAPVHSLALALSSTPHAALLHIAAARGYFRDERLDIRLVPVSHGKAALDLLAQGRVELAAAAEVPFVIAVLNGEPLGIAANMLSVSTEMAVVARRDRGVAMPSDLAGKRVAVTLGTSGEYFLWAFLIRHKLAPGSFTLVDVAPGQMAQALAQGQVDAAALWQPLRLAAESALAGNGVSFTEPDAYTVTHAVVGRSEYLRTQEPALEKLVRALLKAERYVHDEPRESLALAARLLEIDEPELRPIWQELRFRVDLAQSQLVTWEDQARWAVARRYVPSPTLPNFLPHVHADALLGVQPERVTIAR